LAQRDDLVALGRKAVARIEGFYSDNPTQPERDVHFTFLKPDNGEVVVTPSNIMANEMIFSVIRFFLVERKNELQKRKDE